MKKLAIFFLTIFILAVSTAQDSEPLPKRILQVGSNSYTVEVEPTTPLNRRILFVFDKSGSMSVNDLKEAINFVSMIVNQPIDGFEISIVVFANGKARWPGIPDPEHNVPPNWAALPSAVAMDNIVAWLNDLEISTSHTKVVPALIEAFAENRDELSVVVVSDGDFDESKELILQTIRQGQQTRQERGLPSASIMTFCVENHPDDDLTEIGTLGQLGAFYISPPIEEPDDDENH